MYEKINAFGDLNEDIPKRMGYFFLHVTVIYYTIYISANANEY